MRTLKQKIKTWKILAFAGVIPLVFFVVACQDQVMTEVTELAKSANMAVEIPAEVQAKIDELQNAKPDKKFVVIETTTAEGQATVEKIKQNQVASINVMTPTAKPSEPVRTFFIIEYNEYVEKISKDSKLDGDVYTVVEDTAIPNGGLPKFYEHIAKKMLYPAEARKNGIVGKVFVEFVVQPDGSLTNIKTLKGIGMGCDEEAMRAIASYPDKWIPGKNGGVDVKQRMVLPITFKLDGQNGASDNNVTAPEGSINELVVVGANPKVE